MSVALSPCVTSFAAPTKNRDADIAKIVGVPAYTEMSGNEKHFR
jgi:hypothetical protein